MADNSYLMAMRNPILQTNNSYTSPDTRRLTLEEEYNRLVTPQSQQTTQSNPYNDYIQTLNSCTDITKEKILRDERFNVVYAQCEGLLKEYLYSQVINPVLQTQQGRIAFEQLYNTTKSLKEEYIQRDVQKERQLELLMQDEVVLRRLQELQNVPQALQTSNPIQSPTPQQNAPQGIVEPVTSTQNNPNNLNNQQNQNNFQNYNNNRKINKPHNNGGNIE